MLICLKPKGMVYMATVLLEKYFIFFSFSFYFTVLHSNINENTWLMKYSISFVSSIYIRYATHSDSSLFKKKNAMTKRKAEETNNLFLKQYNSLSN